MSDEDERVELALAAIPHRWITRAEAIAHIMNVEQCTREEAEVLYGEFARDCPECVRIVGLH